MARIAGVDLPRNKHDGIALTYIYGIGKAPARASGRRRTSRSTSGPTSSTTTRPSIRDVIESAAARSRAICAAKCDEHQAPDGPRLLPRPRHRKASRSAASAPTPTRAPARVRARAGVATARRKATGSVSHGRTSRQTSATKGEAEGRRPRRTSRAASPTSSDVQQHDRHDHRRQRATCVAWSSAGVRGFKGSRKSTPFAAQLAAEEAARKAMEHGMRSVAVFVKGPGAGRETALRALQPPASRSRSSATSPPSRTTAAGRPSGAASESQRENSQEMARYIGPVCKLCRREGMKLFLKGERCYTDKCGYARRAYPPGQHGQGGAASSRIRRRSCARSRRSGASTACRAPVPRLLPRGDPHRRA